MRQRGLTTAGARRAGLLAGVLLFVFAAPAAAQHFQLTLTPPTFSFPSGDPDAAPVLTAPTLRMDCKATGNPPYWIITIRAETPLTTSGATIDPSNESWVATPSAYFRNGTLSMSEQTLAEGNGNLNVVGYITFSLKNSWDYPIGTYTQTITFTLVAP